MAEDGSLMWFMKYGGGDYWQDVGERFYAKVLAHPVLRRYFIAVSRERVKEIVTDMWQMSLGFFGPMSTSAIEKTHKRLRIASGHFDLYVALFKDTLRDEDITEEEIEELAENVEELRQFVCMED